MKIALIGTRGVPANYGGFETCAEEIGAGLAARGHQVTAYCRHGNAPGEPAEHRGVRLVYCRHIESKYLGTFSHALSSLRRALQDGHDVLMMFNAGNGPLALLARLRGARVAINVDGLEWKRAKWGWFPKLYYQVAEWISTKLAHRIVSDSQAIQQYYLERYRTPSTFIAYGAHVEESRDPDVLHEYGLEKDRYFLIASRLEPENNALCAVEAFEQVETDKKLVIAGGANWKSPYVERIQRTRDDRVRFLGPVYTPGHIRELHCNCFAYIHGNEVGGTNPALLKALGYGNCILALDSPFNAEVLQDAGLLFEKDPADLAEKIRHLLAHPDLVREYRRRGPRRIRDAYRWESITESYERLFHNVISDHYRQAAACD